MNVIVLGGCTLEPLGSYLKALAVLRLVSEQADGSARGWWGGACFCLETELDENGLVAFFLERYAPTPIVSPWNNGSGFYPKKEKPQKNGRKSASGPKKGKSALEELATSTDPRARLYAETIKRARSIPGVGMRAEEADKEAKSRRRFIQLECRNRLPDAAVEWLDAAVGISANDERSFAPIAGSGGNEGNLDYTSTFMGHVVDLLIAPRADLPFQELLKNALLGDPTSAFQPGSVGQYDPGRAGGFNQGEKIEAEDFPSNPWNFVLTLEGAVAWEPRWR